MSEHEQHEAEVKLMGPVEDCDCRLCEQYRGWGLKGSLELQERADA